MSARIDATFGESEWSEETSVAFSDSDIKELWEDVNNPKAEKTYEKALLCLQNGDNAAASVLFKQVSLELTPQWLNDNNEELSEFLEHRLCDTADQIETHSNQLFIDTILKPAQAMNEQALSLKTDLTVSFETNPHLSPDAKVKMRPFLLSHESPLKEPMDAIFKKSRVTANASTMKKSGFITLFVQPRSFIRVVKHPTIKNFLFKLYLDDDLRVKKNTPGWEWLVRRCKGAERIRNVIAKDHIHLFTVPRKWIYPLPAQPSPPLGSTYTRHLAVLIVDDMNLVSARDNTRAWVHKVTTKHLDELYIILSQVGGSSFRGQNIPYTKSGKFAFIDTEYPSGPPDFGHIRWSLRGKMLQYWDSKVRKGGK